jgi:hypothetical protein
MVDVARRFYFDLTKQASCDFDVTGSIGTCALKSVVEISFS